MRVDSFAWLGLEAQALLRVERGELAELDAVGRLIDGQAVDRVDAHDRVVLLATLVLALARLADGADDGVALAQVVLLDLAERDVDVVVARQVAGGAHEGVVVEHVEDAGDRDEDVVLGDLGLEVVAEGRAAAALAVAVAVAAAAVVCRRRRALGVLRAVWLLVAAVVVRLLVAGRSAAGRSAPVLVAALRWRALRWPLVAASWPTVGCRLRLRLRRSESCVAGPRAVVRPAARAGRRRPSARLGVSASDGRRTAPCWRRVTAPRRARVLVRRRSIAERRAAGARTTGAPAGERRRAVRSVGVGAGRHAARSARRARPTQLGGRARRARSSTAGGSASGRSAVGVVRRGRLRRRDCGVCDVAAASDGWLSVSLRAR